MWWWVDPWNAHAYPLLGCRRQAWVLIRSGGGCWGSRSGVRKREIRKGRGRGAGELDHQMVSSIVLPAWSVVPIHQHHQQNQQHRSGVVICSAKQIPPCSSSFQQLRHPPQMKAFAPVCRASSSVKSENVLSMPSLARFVCQSVCFGWMIVARIAQGFNLGYCTLSKPNPQILERNLVALCWAWWNTVNLVTPLHRNKHHCHKEVEGIHTYALREWKQIWSIFCDKW